MGYYSRNITNFQSLKAELDRETITTILRDLGYDIDGRFRFRLRDERTPSTSIRADGFIKDFGGDFAGDLFDLLQQYHEMDHRQAREFVADRLGIALSTSSIPLPILPKHVASTPKRKKNDAVLARELERKAKKYLSTEIPKVSGRSKAVRKKWASIDISENGQISHLIRIDPHSGKLFEGHVIAAFPEYVGYIFQRIVGWDAYFHCPVVVIRDIEGRVVNLVRYRPHRDDYDALPKYLQVKAEERPSYGYLFPFELEMKRLINRGGKCFVGEGLKNALNALTAGAPFVSTESASTIKPELIDWLSGLEDVTLVGAFDGDEAGRKAYERIAAKVPVGKNLFTFDGGRDFTEWVRGGMR